MDDLGGFNPLFSETSIYTILVGLGEFDLKTHLAKHQEMRLGQDVGGAILGTLKTWPLKYSKDNPPPEEWRVFLGGSRCMYL